MQERVTSDEVLKERIKRELARRSLIHFSEYVASYYKPTQHHYLVATYLEQVEKFIATRGAEGIGRLMIFEPPRHGKTEQASRLFPAWVLGRNPDAQVILTSYGADLAQDNSRAVRSFVTSERYAAVFGAKSVYDHPVELSEDSRARSNWDLAQPNRGGVNAAGVGGGITGKGAHLLIIDDPFKNREEAESKNRRDYVASWYRSSAYTRLEDGGAIVIMHTRWHPEDLAGTLLTQMVSDPDRADQWTVVFLPALALADEDYPKNKDEFNEEMLRGIFLPKEDPLGRKPGEALWPDKFDEKSLEHIRANTMEYEFVSLYQQQPRPQSGGFFDENQFVIIDRKNLPNNLQWYRYLDLALGKTESADWNATVAGAIDDDGNLYYRDMLRVHELTDFLTQVVEWMLDDNERGVIWGVESVAFQSLVMRELMSKREIASVAIEEVTPDGDKVTRARPLQTRAKQGKVFIVRGTWNLDFIREVISFPRGKHDDQVDAASGVLQMISKAANQRTGKLEMIQYA